jgi:hypothetical protein
VAAVTYLKTLDELHDDRGARVAADHATATCLDARSSPA